jgi:hypothetical protein
MERPAPVRRVAGALEGLGQPNPVDIPGHEWVLPIPTGHDPQIDETTDELWRHIHHQAPSDADGRLSVGECRLRLPHRPIATAAQPRRPGRSRTGQSLSG